MAIDMMLCSSQKYDDVNYVQYVRKHMQFLISDLFSSIQFGLAWINLKL